MITDSPNKNVYPSQYPNLLLTKIELLFRINNLWAGK